MQFLCYVYLLMVLFAVFVLCLFINGAFCSHTLEQRSKELLCKLERAGVGSRPIIWIGHSMGGLAVLC